MAFRSRAPAVALALFLIDTAPGAAIAQRRNGPPATRTPPALDAAAPSSSPPPEVPSALRVVVQLEQASHLGNVYALQQVAAAVERLDGADAHFVIVVQGSGVTYFRQSEPSNVRLLLSALLATGKVECHIDAASLQRADIPVADVLPNTTVVPSGLLDIARLQQRGHVYLRL
jgi:intracellular sulfur oxidation DsrE/DsrF family protein